MPSTMFFLLLMDWDTQAFGTRRVGTAETMRLECWSQYFTTV